MAEDNSNALAQLQNLVQQIGREAQAIINTNPAATSTASPRALGFALGTTATTVLANSTTRHGLLFHAPGTTTVYVFPGTITTTPTPGAPGGAYIIYGGDELRLTPNTLPNCNNTFSAFGATGTTTPLTVWEFF